MSLTDLRYRVLVVVRAQGRSFADHGQKHHSIGAVDIVVIVSYVDVVVVVVILKDGGLTPGQTSKYFYNISIDWPGLVWCACLVVVVVVIVVVRVGVRAEEGGQGDGRREEVEEGEG